MEILSAAFSHVPEYVSQCKADVGAGAGVLDSPSDAAAKMGDLGKVDDAMISIHDNIGQCAPFPCTLPNPHRLFLMLMPCFFFPADTRAACLERSRGQEGGRRNEATRNLSIVFLGPHSCRRSFLPSYASGGIRVRSLLSR